MVVMVALSEDVKCEVLQRLAGAMVRCFLSCALGVVLSFRPGWNAWFVACLRQRQFLCDKGLAVRGQIDWNPTTNERVTL